MPPNKLDYLADMIMNREIFLNAMDLVEKFSDCALDEANLVITKRGMAMYGINKDTYAGVAIFLKGGVMKEWTVREEFKRTMHPDVMKKIRDFLRKDNKEDVQMTFTEKAVKIQIGNIKKRIDWPKDLEYLGKGETMFKTVQRYSTKTEEIGRVKVMEIIRYIQGASKFQGDGARDMRIKLERKEMTITTEIAQGDELTIDLIDEIENCSKESIVVKFNADDIAIMIQKVSKLADSVMLYARTDRPLLISKEGSNPEKATGFDENLEFYIMIAPRTSE